MRRRAFVALPAASALAAAGYQVLSAGEAEILITLIDAIVPADQDPGAKEAGVVHFIDQQLAGAHKRFVGRYRTELPKLDAACRAATGKGLAELGLRERTAFLERVDQGEVAGGAFFQLVVDHTMQGFYGAPKHGGNRDGVSWRMMGIEKMMGRHGGHA
ncbi:MAG: gluconate 2-dehydrogenase subunit 3 family protein [Acidobacteria bacterium]|nr:gluconate 2-dehydrogenase subunit 3 family protein [Acidobacteriota bacterium]